MPNFANHPALSVVLPSPDGVAAVLETLAHLAQQSIHDQIEVIVVVGPGNSREIPEPVRKRLAASRVIEIPVPYTSGRARATGVRAATGPYVVFGEDHCHADSLWGEAIVKAHHRGADAVAPKLLNANAGSTVSVADHLVAATPWIPLRTECDLEDLPGRNSSFRRGLLMDFGDELESILECDSAMHMRLRSRGARFIFEPGATARHYNYVLLPLSLMLNFHHARIFAARRAPAAGWSKARRLLYGLASPLIPLVRMSRILFLFPHAQCSLPRFLAALPLVMLILIASALGEMTGYLAGEGDARFGVANYEYKHFVGVHRHDSRLSET